MRLATMDTQRSAHTGNERDDWSVRRAEEREGGKEEVKGSHAHEWALGLLTLPLPSLVTCIGRLELGGLGTGTAAVGAA